MHTEGLNNSSLFGKMRTWPRQLHGFRCFAQRWPTFTFRRSLSTSHVEHVSVPCASSGSITLRQVLHCFSNWLEPRVG